ncbi:hypothetical protein C8R47DRAFT_1242398 [Mycena vitilis]|nr:hypothetical protein C8R47DRAFT_1242398 [Mycena vitilis]
MGRRPHQYGAGEGGAQLMASDFHSVALQSVLEHPLSRPEEEIAHSILDFSRCQVSSIRPQRSALAAMVISPDVPNPFAGAASVTGGSLNIKVYFPRAEQPAGQFLNLAASASATVEDVIALALWTYWEKHWLPELNPSRARDIDVAGSWKRWRGKIRNFKFDSYAVVRSPRNLSEKQKIEKQVTRFKFLSPPAVALNKRPSRVYSLPALEARAHDVNPPNSFSKLP